MDYDSLIGLKSTHRALRFLCADNLPLTASFLYASFVKPNRRSIPYGDLTARLDDHLYALRKIYGEDAYPRSGREYLDEWVNPASAYLRKYYVPRSDEPECDLLPETEKALDWLRDLNDDKGFVGTESRLLTLFELLRDLVRQTESNPESRIAALEEKRAAIDAQLENARAGIFDRLQPTQIKERFYEVEETSQKLLADFRQIEFNFRELDRQTREMIATSERAKGQLLDEIFCGRDVIWDSDQGRSFRGFWEFLMSPLRQDELDGLLEALFQREEIRELSADPFLTRIKLFLVEAGEKIYQTSNLLTEQLRKFLDDKAYLESRRVMELIKEIERKAIEIKGNPPITRDFIRLDELAPRLDLAMGRGLFVPAANPVLNSNPVAEGTAEIPLARLYQQVYVDERELQNNIRRALRDRAQISLRELLELFPLRKGATEAIAYLHIAHRDANGMVDENERETIVYERANGHQKILRMPRIIFLRKS